MAVIPHHKCPRCGSFDILIPRGPFLDAMCKKCNHRDKPIKFKWNGEIK